MKLVAVSMSVIFLLGCKSIPVDESFLPPPIQKPEIIKPELVKP